MGGVLEKGLSVGYLLNIRVYLRLFVVSNHRFWRLKVTTTMHCPILERNFHKFRYVTF